MTYFSGSDGSLLFHIDDSWVKVARATNWTLNSSQSSLDTTSLEDTDRTVIPGVRTTTGNCRIFYYQESIGNNAQNYCSLIINTLIKERTEAIKPGQAAKPDLVKFRMLVADGSTEGKRIDVEAYLTSAALSLAVGEVFSAEVNFDVVGAPLSVTI
jgi:hypothetical protein